ncbi:MAG TPA: hypothetical protein DDX72_00035 [Ruminococcaceae bacterium]|nr:hypothetical protein [Oscillospiraceae bacterium]
MLDIFTVSFFGHRQIENSRQVEEQLDGLVRRFIREKEYVDFLVGRNGEFDQFVSSAVRRANNDIDDANSSLILVLPYMTAEYANNKESFEKYYDEVEIFSSGHFKSAFQTRNRSMVDRSDLVVLCIDRSDGGAFQTAKYAKRIGKEYINLGSLDM